MDLNISKMLSAEDHETMAGKNLLDIGGIVLAGDRKQDATPMKIQQKSLKLHERAARIIGSKVNSLDAILADNAAPQGVVEIERQALLRQAGERGKEFDIFGGQVSLHRAGNRRLRI